MRGGRNGSAAIMNGTHELTLLLAASGPGERHSSSLLVLLHLRLPLSVHLSHSTFRLRQGPSSVIRRAHRVREIRPRTKKSGRTEKKSRGFVVSRRQKQATSGKTKWEELSWGSGCCAAAEAYGTNLIPLFSVSFSCFRHSSSSYNSLCEQFAHRKSFLTDQRRSAVAPHVRSVPGDAIISQTEWINEALKRPSRHKPRETIQMKAGTIKPHSSFPSALQPQGTHTQH